MHRRSMTRAAAGPRGETARRLRETASAGIATLIEVLKSTQRLPMEFVLFGLSPAVQDAFRLTHVNRIFRIVETEEQALTPA